MKYKIAIASTDGKVVNQHFGRADRFYIVEVDSDSFKFNYLETRYVEPVCKNGIHDERALLENVHSLGACQYLLVSKIGFGAQLACAKAGIEAFEISNVIEEAITKLISFIKIQDLLQ